MLEGCRFRFVLLNLYKIVLFSKLSLRFLKSFVSFLNRKLMIISLDKLAFR